MLRAVTRGIFSWDFTIFQEERAIADIDMSMWRESAALKVGGQVYSVYRESMLEGTFVLRPGDLILARAQKGFTRTFDIDVAGRHMELKALSLWTREFGVFENNALVGRIGTSSWLGAKGDDRTARKCFLAGSGVPLLAGAHLVAPSSSVLIDALRVFVFPSAD
jgi:hypothetical protein